MIDVTLVEAHLQDAIGLLDESGFPMAAEALRDHLRGIRTAPTAAARLRRICQLRGLFAGTGPGPDVFQTVSPSGAEGVRYARSAEQRRDESRYRKTLDAIQDLLADGEGDDETSGMGWSPSIARVA